MVFQQWRHYWALLDDHLDFLRIQFPVFNPISSGNGVKQEKRPFGSRAKSFVTSCLQCLFFLTQPKQIVFLPKKGHTSENESRKLSYYTRKKRMRFNLSIDCLQACFGKLVLGNFIIGLRAFSNCPELLVFHALLSPNKRPCLPRSILITCQILLFCTLYIQG